MNPLVHAINIGTLATWLSVAGFGAMAGAFPHRPPTPPATQLLDALPVSQDFILGDEVPNDDSPPEIQDSAAPTLPAPPEIPDIAESEPLPEIPEFPAPKPLESPVILATKPAVRPAVTGKVATATRPTTQAARSTTNARSAKPSGGGSAMSDSARLTAGRMPAPKYPPFARRNGQSGTVLVEFTVDASGRVISAYAKSSSNWPLLDNEAVRTVRSWRFPAGSVTKLQRPIVFRLN